jgi:hypothetical protein
VTGKPCFCCKYAAASSVFRRVGQAASEGAVGDIDVFPGAELRGPNHISHFSGGGVPRLGRFRAVTAQCRPPFDRLDRLQKDLGNPPHRRTVRVEIFGPRKAYL